MEPILDTPTLEPVDLHVASKVTRIGHYFGDFLAIAVVSLLILRAIGMNVDEISIDQDLFLQIGFLLFYLVWQTLFEALTGKTVLKFITKTHVVNMDGSKPTFKTIMLRNLCRFIPFNALSFLGNRGWHDSVSKTQVVMD